GPRSPATRTAGCGYGTFSFARKIAQVLTQHAATDPRKISSGLAPTPQPPSFRDPPIPKEMSPCGSLRVPHPSPSPTQEALAAKGWPSPPAIGALRSDLRTPRAAAPRARGGEAGRPARPRGLELRVGSAALSGGARPRKESPGDDRRSGGGLGRISRCGGLRLRPAAREGHSLAASRSDPLRGPVPAHRLRSRRVRIPPAIGGPHRRHAAARGSLALGDPGRAGRTPGRSRAGLPSRSLEGSGPLIRRIPTA